MNFIFIEELKTLSGYTEIRSLRKWLAGMNLHLIKIGKRHAVDRDRFEKILDLRFGAKKSRMMVYQPKHQTEKDFLSELKVYLSK